MKQLLLIILAALYITTAHAQNDERSKRFINEIVETHIIYKDSVSRAEIHKMFGGKYANGNVPYQYKKELIVFRDSASNNLDRLVEDAFKYNKAKVFYHDRKDSVIYIDTMGKRTRMLASEASPLVVNNFGSMMRRIIADSVVLSDAELAYIKAEINKQRNRKWHTGLLTDAKLVEADTINNAFKDLRKDGWRDMNNKGIHKFYTFSVPVFLRNESLCVFYYDESCGYTCGYGELAIYKKVNGKWVNWATMSSWIS